MSKRAGFNEPDSLQLGDKGTAKACYASALRLAGTKAEKAFLASRLKEVGEF